MAASEATDVSRHRTFRLVSGKDITPFLAHAPVLGRGGVGGRRAAGFREALVVGEGSVAASALSGEGVGGGVIRVGHGDRLGLLAARLDCTLSAHDSPPADEEGAADIDQECLSD